MAGILVAVRVHTSITTRPFNVLYWANQSDCYANGSQITLASRNGMSTVVLALGQQVSKISNQFPNLEQSANPVVAPASTALSGRFHNM